MITVLKMNPRAPFSLSELPVGQRARVAAVVALTPTTLRLQELGFTEGAVVEMVRRGPFGDPLEVRLKDTRVCLRVDDARRFHVVVDDAEASRSAS